MLRKYFVFVALTAALVMVGIGLFAETAVAAASNAFPEIIPLPNGFQPEGVVTGHGHTIYAGSLADGSIYEADLRTGEGEILVDAPGGMAVGLAFDNRSNNLFVSGGMGGTATVYDADSGALLEQYQLTAGPAFINDAIVTRNAVYFTNSFAPEFYRLPLGPGGSLSDASDLETIALGGDYVQVGGFNVNGIVASADGRYLIIVNTTAQTLYRVDPLTGDAVAIDLGGASLPNGDGLVLAGKTLYVVQNFSNQIAVIELNNTLTAGTLVDTITNAAFDIPTTAALFGNNLYTVNARFSTPPMAVTEYDIVQVER
jgi:sugar lactone lactonase YvrE